ncbi:MAG: hypothetical protein LBL69_05905 [Zoogloeaceae bacterium]|jgi:hypothetical protein|nr:hypothetical protein [Zoogloeaceae bacterium]
MAAPDTDPRLLATLPPVLRAVVKALGFARARGFLAEHGGRPANIPLRLSVWGGLEPDELARLRAILPLDHSV